MSSDWTGRHNHVKLLVLRLPNGLWPRTRLAQTRLNRPCRPNLASSCNQTSILLSGHPAWISSNNVGRFFTRLLGLRIALLVFRVWAKAGIGQSVKQFIDPIEAIQHPKLSLQALARYEFAEPCFFTLTSIIAIHASASINCRWPHRLSRAFQTVAIVAWKKVHNGWDGSGSVASLTNRPSLMRMQPFPGDAWSRPRRPRQALPQGRALQGGGKRELLKASRLH